MIVVVILPILIQLMDDKNNSEGNNCDNDSTDSDIKQ